MSSVDLTSSVSRETRTHSFNREEKGEFDPTQGLALEVFGRARAASDVSRASRLAYKADKGNLSAQFEILWQRIIASDRNESVTELLAFLEKYHNMLPSIGKIDATKIHKSQLSTIVHFLLHIKPHHKANPILLELGKNRFNASLQKMLVDNDIQEGTDILFQLLERKHTDESFEAAQLLGSLAITLFKHKAPPDIGNLILNRLLNYGFIGILPALSKAYINELYRSKRLMVPIIDYLQQLHSKVAETPHAKQKEIINKIQHAIFEIGKVLCEVDGGGYVLLDQLSDQGFTEVHLYYARVADDPETSLQEYLKAAQKGNTQAKKMINMLHRQGKTAYCFEIEAAQEQAEPQNKGLNHDRVFNLVPFKTPKAPTPRTPLSPAASPSAAIGSLTSLKL